MPIPTRDDVFEALSAQPRRRLLLVLMEDNPHEDPGIPDDAPEADGGRESPPEAMYHRHLPKLEEQGFIDWDRDAHVVTKGPDFEEIRPILELLGECSEESSTNRP